MICRKCANMFDDSLSSCPECGTPAIMETATDEKEEKKPFVLNIPEEEINEDFEDAADLTAEEPIQASEIEQEAEYSQEADAEIEEAAEEEQEIVYEAPEYEGEAELKREMPKVKKLKKAEKSAKKESIGDKSAAALIVSLMCILACMMMVLTVVSVKSDVFKKDEDSVKTVALSSLSGAETGELEQWLSRMGAVSDVDFDCKSSTVTQVFSFVKPGDMNGLYGKVFGRASLVTESPDPAQRFKNDLEEYSYYKIEQAEIDEIISLFGLTANHTVNTDDVYYYDGYYYFADDQSEEKAKDYIVDVSSGKRVQDGGYYIKCSFIAKDDASVAPQERFAIVEKLNDGQTGKSGWVMTKISKDPVFDESGVLIKSEKEISYEIKTEIIEKKADDGTVYHKYVIEYPVFSGDGMGVQVANQLFSDMVSAFENEEQSVQKAYSSFVENGGDVNELPLLTHVVSRVTGNENGYISVLEETSEYVPSSMPVEGEASEEETEADPESEVNEPVTLPKKTVEGYNFDVETGDFISKDAIIGKDYLLISKLLYRIYGGYGYEDIIEELKNKTLEESQQSESEQNADESAQQEEIPEDEDGLGMKIYESASVICKEGYLFCYVTEDGCSHDVIIPFDIPGLFTVNFG